MTSIRRLALVIIACVVVVLGMIGGRVSQRFMQPEVGRPGLQINPTATPTQDPYPGDSPGFAPTPTAIPTQSRKYEGWTGEEIADDLGELMVATPNPWSSEATTYEDSAEITTSDAEALGLPASSISYQSPTDIAIILSGDFLIPHRGATLATQEPADYILLVIDTYSGAVRLRVESNSLSELQAMLP